jgi:hypothetical protein
MDLKNVVLVLGSALVLAGCATGPCGCANCAPIGWFTDHYTGVCTPAAEPAPPPPPPPPPPTERRGG